jgi:hypothetical protein
LKFSPGRAIPRPGSPTRFGTIHVFTGLRLSISEI